MRETVRVITIYWVTATGCATIGVGGLAKSYWGVLGGSAIVAFCVAAGLYEGYRQGRECECQ